MSRSDATYIGVVRSVSGAVVSIQLREDLASTLVMVAGESHRVGQIGSFLRIPLGYAFLFGVVTQVGAAAAPSDIVPGREDAYRWVSVTLFGEAVSGQFERGVSQYPTVGDEVHVVTRRDLEVIYDSSKRDAPISVGTISSASGLVAELDLAKLVSRHGAVVGSTGAGKSNMVAVLLEAIVQQGFPSARVLVLDVHGEYADVVANSGYTFRIRPTGPNEKPLVVPYWALPCDEYVAITMGALSAVGDAAVRDAMVELKRAAAKLLNTPPPEESINADSPIPFSARQLWFQLDDDERRTYADSDKTTPTTRLVNGDPNALKSNQYPAPNPGNKAPFRGTPRGIGRQLELMRSRLADSRFSFLLAPGVGLTTDLKGKAQEDLHTLVASWVGHDRPLTVLDISGVPGETMTTVAGTVLRIVYDTLFWAGALPVSGKRQPLLIVIEEAHRLIPAGMDSPSRRIIAQIAKEGRKYGVGLLVVTQRPTEIEPAILSQCGTIISLRLANAADRGIVMGMMPDDLGNLAAMLPSLRTGEGLAVGEAMSIPTRMRFRQAGARPNGDDPKIGDAWRQATRPDPSAYENAVVNWRKQSQ